MPDIAFDTPCAASCNRSLRASLHSLEPLLHPGSSGGDGREDAPLDAVCEIVDASL
jgi:hypothetical protein